MRTCIKCGNVIENDNAKFCKKCGTQWASKPNDLLNYHGCPNCHNKSRGESKVKQYLIQRNIGVNVYEKSKKDPRD